MSNILLVNDNVQDYQTIINACRHDTYAITYNEKRDTYDSIFAKYENIVLKNNIQLVNHLALVSHGSNNPEFTFLEKENKMLISQYLPDLSNCASCQTNETEDNDLFLNNIDELFDNTPDIHKCIVDLSLNITQEEFDTKETYTSEEILSIFKDVSCNVFDTLEPLRDISGSDETYEMPLIYTLIEDVYYTITDTSGNADVLTDTSGNADVLTDTSGNADVLTDTSGNADVLTDISLNGYILNTLDTWSTFKEFIKKFNIHKFLDFLGCALLQSNNWKYILTELETEQHLDLNIRASDDKTGNLKVGGDWVLETDNVNIKELYFDSDTIEKWKYTLTHFTSQSRVDIIETALNALVFKTQRQSKLNQEASNYANAAADEAFAITGDSNIAYDEFIYTYNWFLTNVTLVAAVAAGADTPLPQTNIKFSDLQTFYNNANPPTDLINPISLGEFKGCEFVQPITSNIFDSNYEQLFTSPGTFTVPAGVTYFSAVCVGGGGGGSASTTSNNGYSGGGGGGGALHWRTTLNVLPGTVFNIYVGAGGSPGSSSGNNNAQNGGETSIKIGSTYYLRAGGGIKGTYNSNSRSDGGTTYFGTYGGGGGNGGKGGGGQSGNTGGGGGGAGGYSGNGGNGSTGTIYTELTAGQGGGGGGGTGHNSYTSAGVYGGGGVGILIGEGTSGAANLTTYNKQGNPGSGGSNKNYGGGGAGAEDDSGAAGASGGPGAVRIIWGGSPGTRAYPSTFVPINSEIPINPTPPPIPPVPLTNISIDTVFKGFTFINMAPIMTITAVGSGGSALSYGDSTDDTYLNLTFTSSEPTSDFDINSITVTNGTLSAFTSVSSTQYTTRFTPNNLTDGTPHTIDVLQGAYTNNKTTIGCQNNAATQFNWSYVTALYEFGHFNTSGTATIYGSLSNATVSPSGYNFTSHVSSNINWQTYSMGSEFLFNTSGKIVALGVQNRYGGKLSIFKTPETGGGLTAVATVDAAGTNSTSTAINIKYYTLASPIIVAVGDRYRTAFKNTVGGYSYSNIGSYDGTTTTSGNITLVRGVYGYSSGSNTLTQPQYPTNMYNLRSYGGTDIIFTP